METHKFPFRRDSTNLIIFLSSLIFVISLFAFVFADLNEFEISRMLFSSDTLYLPSLYWDLIENGNNLSDWRLNGAPNFFPDQGVFFILMKLSSSDIKISFIAFALLQLLFIDLLFLGILKQVTKHYLSMMVLANVMLSVFAVIKIFTGEYLLVHNIIVNSFHLGAFVNSLAATLLVFSIINNSKMYKYVLLMLLCLLAVVSDKIFLIEFVIPMCLPLFIAVLRCANKSILVKVFMAIALSSLFGNFLLKYLIDNHIITLATPNLAISVERILFSIGVIISDYTVFLEMKNLVSVVFITYFLGLFYAVYVYIVKKMYLFNKEGDSKEIIFYNYIIISTLMVLVLPVFLGSYTGMDSVRYNFQSYLFFLMMLPFLLYKYLFNENIKLRYYSLGGVTVLFLCCFFSVNKVNLKEGYTNYFKYKPQIAIAVDKFFDQTGASIGTAEYWDAKVATMFSERGVVVFAVFDDLTPFEHVTNISWFINHPVRKTHRSEFSFTINPNENCKNRLEEIGVINDSVSEIVIDEVTFLSHDKYFYDHKPWQGYKIFLKE